MMEALLFSNWKETKLKKALTRITVIILFTTNDDIGYAYSYCLNVHREKR